MGRRLTANVALRNPETLTVEVFAAGDEVPGWAANKITFPDAWTEDVGDEPPRAGRGSGLEAWQAHLDTHDIDYPDDASRDDLIAIFDAA